MTMRIFLVYLVLCVLGAAFLLTPVYAAEEPATEAQRASPDSTDGSQTPSTDTRGQDTRNTVVSGSAGVKPEVRFVPLVGLPGLTDSTAGRSLAGYLNALFRLAIGIGALLAVIRIVLAGIKYMSSDAFSSKEDAKRDITGSLFGLLLILSTVVIVRLINPGILELNVLQDLEPVEVTLREPPLSATYGSGQLAQVDVSPSDRAAFEDKLAAGREVLAGTEIRYSPGDSHSSETRAVVKEFWEACLSKPEFKDRKPKIHFSTIWSSDQAQIFDIGKRVFCTGTTGPGN